MENEYNSGDIVYLKSGGPKMTVYGSTSILPISYTCSWFTKKGKRGHATFREEMLTSEDPNQK